MAIAIDLSPIRRNADYRWLFLGQFVSKIGSMVTYVAFQYHIYSVTQSTLWVGLAGMAQLVPLVLTGFWGGALADSLDRRRLIIYSESGLALILLILAGIAYTDLKSPVLLLFLSALSASLTGIHRPALEALTPRLIEPEDIPKVSSINSFKFTIGAIAGPALGGILISQMGLYATYLFDAGTFAFSIFCLLRIRRIPKVEKAESASFRAIQEGFRYALSRRDLLGTYLIDMVAMFFAFPYPLFPAMAEMYGGTHKLGYLYAAPSVGAFVASVTSGWTYRVRRHGMAIAVAAAGWCLCMIAFGLNRDFEIALFILGLAGFSDMISGIFRGTMWNQTIPDQFRGRLAGVEMISYMSGPMAGNTWMGATAEKWGVHAAVGIGGLLGTVGVTGLTAWLREFREYTRESPPS